MKPLSLEYTRSVLAQLQELPPDAGDEARVQTAARLRVLNWEPILLTDPSGFLEITREQLSAHIRQLTSRHTDLTEQHLSLLLYHYRLLQRLRRDEPEAWDKVNELMEDD